MFLKQLSDNEKMNFLKLAYKIVLKDGEFGNEEKDIISQYIIEMELIVDINSFEVLEKEDALIKSFSSTPRDIIKKIFIELLSLALCDQNYNIEEEKIIKCFMSEYGLDNEFYDNSRRWIIKLNELYSELAELIKDI